jgi:hypothetical protein
MSDCYLLLPFAEVEVRLGTYFNKFDSNIDKKYFYKIMENLEFNKSIWKDIIATETVEYVSVSDTGKNVKMIENGSHKEIIMKDNVLTQTIQIKNSPFDVRLAVNQEFKLNSYLDSFSKQDCITRHKNRKSYISENFRYDLTIVKETSNNITKDKHEIEIELLQNDHTINWNKKYIVDFFECKVYDLINIVEPMDRETIKFKF